MVGKKETTPAQKNDKKKEKTVTKDKDADEVKEKKVGGGGPGRKQPKRAETYSVYIYRVLK